MSMLESNREVLSRQFLWSPEYEFAETISTAPVEELMVQPDLKSAQPSDEAGKRFIAMQYKPETTFYVTSEFKQVSGSEIIGFEPFVSSTGVLSYHGVFFGGLETENGSQIPVAVKPHEIVCDDVVSKRDAEKSCFSDYFTNVAAKLGHLCSLEPVGFILGKDGDPYTITLLEDDLTTLDSIDWTVFYREGTETVGMRDIWKKTAVNVANLHSIGDSLHGDLATRNIATNSDGQILLIDWEHGNITESNSGDIEERFGNSLVDLRKLMDDMARPTHLLSNPGVGLFQECSGSWWEAYVDIFYDKYKEWREVHAAQGKHHTQRVENTEDELVQLDVTLKAMMDRHEHKYRQS